MYKTLLSWSTGKDAAYSLYLSMQQNQKPDALLTTVNQDFERVSMHGIKLNLLEQQAERLGLPIFTISMHKDVSMADYNQIMFENLIQLKAKGFEQIIFGDIFLEDLKIFREKELSKIPLKANFPLWQKDTRILAKKIIASGIKAIVVSVNAKYLDKSFAGRIYDESFLNDLPDNVDWCGENGAFHTFVFDSPDFSSPIDFTKGEIVFKSYKSCTEDDENSYKKDSQGATSKWDTGFWFIDLN